MTRHSNPLRARRRGVAACVLAHCSLAYLEATLAQEQGQVTIDARRCLELEAPDERLACFETQVDEARRRGSRVPVTAAAPAPSPQQPTPVVEVATQPGQREPADAPNQREWVGTITSLKERAPNQFLITLDSGEIWQQHGAQRYGLRVGQRVRIYQGRFGLRLEADGVNGFIQVDRVP